MTSRRRKKRGRSRWGGGVTANEMHEMTWVRPELVAQVSFVEWTAEGPLAADKQHIISPELR